MKYFIGERVIYGNAICTVVPGPKEYFGNWDYWIFDSSVGYEHGVSENNLKSYEQDAITFRKRQ